jgi:hypothetical protein
LGAQDDCKRELRVVKVDHIYMIQGRGKHSAFPKGIKKRVNSILTVDQEKLLSFALNQGGKPAGIRVAMTKQKMWRSCSRVLYMELTHYCTRSKWVA